MTTKVEQPYRVTTPDPRLAKSRTLSGVDRIVLGLIMVIAAAVRLYKLNWPASVVFDEVHFGGFARKYIIGRFFFDVHPPLAKMLFAVAGYLSGFRGDFEFKNIGDDYILPKVPYVGMRLLPTLMGLGTIALCYTTIRASGCRTLVAAAGALLLTFENTHATESRYILLDSPLLFFIAITAYGYKKFENEVPFTKNWYKFLLLTGLGLGATVSSKWVGLFTIGWVGSMTLWQLWWIMGDRSVSVPSFFKHFNARAICLIIVPAAFYVSMFVLHFMCVDNQGGGAEFMPREFSATLKHNKLPTDIPADVGIGSVVSIRHVNTRGGWLHSHNSSYETGSQQQQITLYAHADNNNNFLIENATTDWNPDNLSFVPLKDGDKIRLKHVETERRLHSHDHRAPVTTHDYINEVSGYGFPGFEGDANDDWRVKIIERRSFGKGKEQVQALRTYFQLKHEMTGCLLYSKKVKLPAWGFEQQEVSCIRNGAVPNTLWYIEQNIPPKNADPNFVPELVSYRQPGFLENFINLNKAMWRVNKGLTDPHTWESRPLSWLTLRRGINMWGRHHRQVYLIGNLPVYLTITASVLLYLLYKGLQVLYWQRFSRTPLGLPQPSSKASEAATLARTTAWGLFDQQFGCFLLAWWFHYFPSFFMVRQLFLHHYLASVYFGILCISQVFELLIATFPVKKIAKLLTVAYVVGCIAFFVWYSPLVYGGKWTKEKCLASKFNDMDFDCNLFFSNDDGYADYDATVSESISKAKLGITDAEEPAETGVPQDAQAQPEEINQEPVQEEVVIIDDVNNAPVDPQEPVAEESTDAAEVEEEIRVAEEIIQQEDAPPEQPAEPAEPNPVEPEQPDRAEPPSAAEPEIVEQP